MSEPAARACYVYDLDQLEQRARRFTDAFAPLGPLVAFALKANALPALLESLARVGLAADAASLGELTLAAAAGFDEKRRVFNGNGKTPEELEWVARHGVHSVNADSVEELRLRVRVMTDWRRQVNEHKTAAIVAAAAVGFIVGRRLFARRGD